MTLVAAIFFENYPFLVGDLLISSPTRHEMNLPGPGRFAPEDSQLYPGFYPSGLRQKLALLSPNLAVGWSGSFISAFHVIGKLRAHFRDQPARNTEVLEFIDTLDSDFTRELSLVGLCVHGLHVGRFGYDADAVDHPLLGRMEVAGSGSRNFQQHLDDIDPTLLLHLGEPNVHESALAKVILFAGGVFANEADTRANLAHLYGGGYEFVTVRFHDDGTLSLVKIPSINYAFWAVSDDRTTISLPLLLNFRYQDDLLLVTRLVPGSGSLVPGTTDGGALKEWSTDLITPIDRILQPNERTPPQGFPDLNATRLVSFLYLPPETGGREILVCLDGGMPLPIRLRSEGVRYSLLVLSPHISAVCSNRPNKRVCDERYS